MGKWHLGFFELPYIPVKRGFDTSFGFWDGSEDHYSHSVEGFLDFHDGEDPARDWNRTYAMYAYMQVKYDPAWKSVEIVKKIILIAILDCTQLRHSSIGRYKKRYNDEVIIFASLHF